VQVPYCTQEVRVGISGVRISKFGVGMAKKCLVQGGSLQRDQEGVL
jgi:hypothetical protein